MNEKTKPEAEIKDTTLDELEEAVHAVVGETVKLLESLGKAFMNTAQDVSKLMVIKVDDQIRDSLDTLVDAGLSNNRRQAASTMMEEGINAKSVDFQKIEKTKEEIAKLRQQMQSLVPGQG